MQTLEQPNERAADLYWLAFLLTGHSGASVEVTLEALNLEALDLQDGTDSFFSTWMIAWSRKLVIAKALSAVRAGLAESARRTSKRAEGASVPSRDWALDEGTSKIQLERSLLAIDVLPRCALVLSVFEGMPLEDAAILLNVDGDLVRKAQIIGLRELTSNLARMQGRTSSATGSYVMTSEMQHA